MCITNHAKCRIAELKESSSKKRKEKSSLMYSVWFLLQFWKMYNKTNGIISVRFMNVSSPKIGYPEKFSFALGPRPN